MKQDFTIDTQFYPEELIQKALKDFWEYGVVFVSPNISIPWESKEEIDEVFNEFMNYCISLYNESL